MTEKQRYMIYELMRTEDFRSAIAEICEHKASKATDIMGSSIEDGNTNRAAIARGEAKAWGEVVRVLDRVAKKAAPDNS